MNVDINGRFVETKTVSLLKKIPYLICVSKFCSAHL